MATYKFRTTFDDHEDVIRDIEIRSTQTFEDLHHAIHNSIGFDASKQASFYMSDDNWKKGKEITNRELTEEETEKAAHVKKSRLCDFIVDPHQKIYYVFDKENPWTFHIELIKISREEEAGVNYPRCIRAVGDAPKQYQSVNIATLPIPEDFELAIDVSDEDEETEETETVELGVELDELPEGVEKADSYREPSDDAPSDFENAEEPGEEESSTNDSEEY